VWLSLATIRLPPRLPHIPMILPLGQAQRRRTTITPTRRTRPLRTMATGRQARRRFQWVLAERQLERVGCDRAQAPRDPHQMEGATLKGR